MTSPTYHGKVTILKLTLSVVVVVVLITLGVLFSNKKDKESVDALDANPYSISGSPEDTTLETVDMDSDSDLSADCGEGTDCGDQDNRDSQPSSNAGISAPATSDSSTKSQTDLAIEEEGIPAVDEKPAKTN